VAHATGGLRDTVLPFNPWEGRKRIFSRQHILPCLLSCTHVQSSNSYRVEWVLSDWQLRVCGAVYALHVIKKAVTSFTKRIVSSFTVLTTFTRLHALMLHNEIMPCGSIHKHCWVPAFCLPPMH